jgi:hypothetical protein
MLAECIVERREKERKELEEKIQRDQREANEREDEEREVDRQLKLKELELKKLQMIKDEEGRKNELELKMLQMTKEEEGRKADLAARQEKAERAKRKEKEEEIRMNSADMKAKRYGDALRGCVAKMPNDPVEILPWFRSVEKLFADFKIEKELQVHLLKPYLTTQAVSLVARLDPTVASDFKSVKDAILHEFKLSPTELLSRFSRISKGRDETYVLFSNRLKSLLLYYLESRKCGDFQKLIELLVCDRIKQSLPDAVLRYILSLENNRDGSWIPLTELTSSLDIYSDTHFSEGPRHVVGVIGTGNGSKFGARAPPARPPPPKFNVAKPCGSGEPRNDRSRGNQNATPGSVKRCFVCNATTHLASFHGKTSAGTSNNGKPRTALTAVVKQEGGLKVNAGRVESEAFSHDISREDSVSLPSGVCKNENVETAVKASLFHVMVEPSAPVNDNTFISDCGDINVCVTNCVIDSTCKANEESLSSNVAPLRYVSVRVGDGERFGQETLALYDTRAEIPLAQPKILDGLNLLVRGQVTIRSTIGESVKCDLYRISVSLVDVKDDVRDAISVLCAVTEKANEPLILTADAIDRLMTLNCSAIRNVDTSDSEVKVDETASNLMENTLIVEDGEPAASSSESNENSMKLSASVDTLRSEQEADQSLNGYRALCAKGKGGF